MGKYARILFIALIVVLAAVALTACTDNLAAKKEGYIEVSSLRVPSASIYLSPSGETSRYQLDVEIVPKNATNRLLYYYVNSADLKYLNVSETGLVTAVAETPKNYKAPIRISSSSNDKASVVVNAVVEFVPVQSLAFTSSTETLLVGGAGKQLSLIFEPYHAQDGRNVRFRSLNPAVATVDDDGFVTPVSVGSAHICAESNPSNGTVKKAYSYVYVSYASGANAYTLVVSDTVPAYRQLVGGDDGTKKIGTQITFEVLQLKSDADPNPKINWYVADQLVAGESERTYRHFPNVEARATYTVKVRIQPYQEAEQFLESNTITIYNPFSGFTFDVSNFDTTAYKEKYQYGDEASFEITAGDNGIVRYDWYLQRVASGFNEIYVGQTSVTDKTLVRRLNIEGDYKLTAYGITPQGARGPKHEFEFGVERLVVGDTLAIAPVLSADGIPPESYNWWSYRCDAQGNILEDASGEQMVTLIGSTVAGERLYYPLNRVGYEIIEAYGILDGVVAEVSGKKFYCRTGVLRVCDTNAENILSGKVLVDPNAAANKDYLTANVCRINGLYIEGININGEAQVFVRFDYVRGAQNFVVEITRVLNGKTVVTLIDSSNSPDLFLNSSVAIPTSIVTLEDRFALRVKQKGSLYTQVYRYGYEEAIPVDAYEYLYRLSGNENLYIVDNAELFRAIEYVYIFMPRDNPYVTHTLMTGFATCTLRLYIAYDFDPSSIASGMLIIERIENNVYSFAISKSTAVAVPPTPPSPPLFTAGTSDNYAENPYGNNKNEFSIDIMRNVMYVETSEQLVLAMLRGYRALPSSQDVSSLYSAIKAIIKTISGEDLTDAQRARAFFDYLALNVALDTDNVTNSGTLEHVFIAKRANAEALCRAFAVMCLIEGIPVKTAYAGQRAVNEILIDDVWYIVDIASAMSIVGGVTQVDGAYFMIPEN